MAEDAVELLHRHLDAEVQRKTIAKIRKDYAESLARGGPTFDLTTLSRAARSGPEWFDGFYNAIDAENRKARRKKNRRLTAGP
jgi:hypothetical protein